MKKEKVIRLIKKILLVIILLIIISIILNNTKGITTITQLSPQTSRQMMGYIIKLSDGKIIVIDGGTIDDTQNLIDKINLNGGKVDYWFITHIHDDHAGAFTEIVNNTDIEIKEMTHTLDLEDNRKLSWDDRFKNVEDLLKIYQNANLVITSRLHCSLPGLALNVPVIVIVLFDP